jgi:hypothetical protein
MDKYTELEKLSNLKEKGIISESEFESEKAKILGKSTDANQKSSKVEATASEAEIEIVRSYDKNREKARELASTGAVLKNYLIVSFFAALFAGVSSNSFSGDTKAVVILAFGALFGLPTIFILPIFLMRTKARNAAHQEARNIIEELEKQTEEVERIRGRMSNTKTNTVDSSVTSVEDSPLVLSQNRRNLLLSLSVIMFISFFIPWFSFNGLSANGVAILKGGEEYKSCYLIILLPVLSLLAIGELLKPNTIPVPKAKLLPLIAGLAPYFLLAILYFANSNEINNIVSMASKVREFSRSVGNNDDISKIFSQYLGIVSAGFYLTITSSALLVFFSPKKSI